MLSSCGAGGIWWVVRCGGNDCNSFSSDGLKVRPKWYPIIHPAPPVDTTLYETKCGSYNTTCTQAFAPSGVECEIPMYINCPLQDEYYGIKIVDATWADSNERCNLLNDSCVEKGAYFEAHNCNRMRTCLLNSSYFSAYSMYSQGDWGRPYLWWPEFSLCTTPGETPYLSVKYSCDNYIHDPLAMCNEETDVSSSNATTRRHPMSRHSDYVFNMAWGVGHRPISSWRGSPYFFHVDAGSRMWRHSYWGISPTYGVATNIIMKGYRVHILQGTWGYSYPCRREGYKITQDWLYRDLTVGVELLMADVSFLHVIDGDNSYPLSHFQPYRPSTQALWKATSSESASIQASTTEDWMSMPGCRARCATPY